MSVRVPEVVSSDILKYGYFDEDVCNYLIALLRPGSTFYDIGAHYGFFTLLASELVAPAGKVVAFEPTPSTFALLRTNCGQLQNVVLRNEAVWSQRATLTLRDYGSRYSSLNTLLDAPRGRTDSVGKQVTVGGGSLDDFARASVDRPSLIKIDAEGAEAQVVSGMKQLLQECRPSVILEVNAQTSQIVEVFEQYGYLQYSWLGGQIRRSNRPSGGNVLLATAETIPLITLHQQSAPHSCR